MKKTFFYALLCLTFIACQPGKKDDKTTTQKEKSSVNINYETESGIPRFSAESKEPVELKYNFNEGDSAHMVMNYEMVMEMMGQKTPLNMTMESNYRIKEVKENGNAVTAINFTRVAMSMEGPQPMQFDSDNEENMQNNRAADQFKVLLDNEISSEITPKGKVVQMNLDAMLDDIPEQAQNMTAQVESMSDQFAQNAFVALPEKPVKAGDTYDAGTIETGRKGLQMDVNMKYKVLSISADKRYVILKPDGSFKMNTSEEGMEMNAENNSISGWILFDLQRGFLTRSNMNMNMDITTKQMGQEMPIKMQMNIKMEMK